MLNTSKTTINIENAFFIALQPLLIKYSSNDFLVVKRFQRNFFHYSVFHIIPKIGIGFR